MRSSLHIALALITSACVTPRPPGPDRPLTPDRYARAADPHPRVRTEAAAELAYDPSPQAVQLLLAMQQRDVDPAVRAAASEAIADRRHPSLDVTLEAAAAREPDPGARAAASSAYRRLHPWRKRTGVAAGLGALCPGCGHLYLGQTGEGLAYLGTAGALLVTGVALIDDHTISFSGADSAEVPVGLFAIGIAQNLWFYSIFDAYRDTRVAQGDVGYSFAVSRESLPALAAAPFKPRVLASPWVWAGVPIALAAGLGLSFALDGELASGPSIFDVDRVNFLGHRFSPAAGFALGEGYYGALFDAVGVGEEALFRGVIQTELEERFGTYGGLVVASLIFGAIHIPNYSDVKTAAIASPFIALVGGALGLAYIHTDHRLETSVAMHFWYDFLLSTTAFIVDPENQAFVVNYAMPL